MPPSHGPLPRAPPRASSVSLNVNVFLRSVISALGVLGFMFHINVQLSIVTFVSIPVVVLGSKVYGAFVRALRSDRPTYQPTDPPVFLPTRCPARPRAGARFVALD